MWCFAFINNRLAELYFDRDKKGRLLLEGHGYIDDTKGWTREEKKWIPIDTKKYQFSYRKGYYRDKINGIRYKSVRPRWLKEISKKNLTTFSP